MILRVINSQVFLRNLIKQQYRCMSFNKSKYTEEQAKPNNKKENNSRVSDIPSFMPVINIPVAEFAHNAFYSLHRPLLGLSIPQPFLVGNIVGQITNDDDTAEEDFLQYMSTLKPYEPPSVNTLKDEENNTAIITTTTTLTVEVDPSYFMNHNNNHDEIADYLSFMHERIDSLLINNKKQALKKKKIKRLRKRKD